MRLLGEVLKNQEARTREKDDALTYSITFQSFIFVTWQQNRTNPWYWEYFMCTEESTNWSQDVWKKKQKMYKPL